MNTSAPALALPKILLVDDEVNVLYGLSRQLYRKWSVSTASKPEEALEMLRTEGPFVVIVSDMRMPGMNGAALLHRALELAPETVRVLLTGQSEFEALAEAVNQGHIFRFLAKPCTSDLLHAALNEALGQHQLMQAERDLLENTLRGAIAALVETLSITQPLAFGKAMRLRTLAADLARRLSCPAIWPIEVAAMMSQLGTVVLPPSVLERAQAGGPLDAEEQAMVKRVPAVTDALIGHLPRLEAVREILRHHQRSFSESAGSLATTIPLGARILRVVEDFDTLQTHGHAAAEALRILPSHADDYDPAVLDALRDAFGAAHDDKNILQEVRVADLRTGMMLMSDVYAKTGMLLVTRGNEVTVSMLERIRNFRRIGVREPILVRGNLTRG